MAEVKDPYFWQRFSRAVHMDEEAAAETQRQKEQSPEPKSRWKMARSESWLKREKAKKKLQSYICWTFWIVFLALIAAIVAVIVFCDTSGLFHKLSQMTAPHHDGDDGGS